MRRRQGGALLTALFIMVLMAIMATAILSRLHLDIVRTTELLQTNRLYQASKLVPFWAMSILQQSGRPLMAQDERGLVAVLPEALQQLYPGVQVKGELYDLQARLNVNDLLVMPVYQTAFLALMQRVLAANENINLLKMIVHATANWIAPDVAGHGRDKWAHYYASMRPPYQAAHVPFVSVSEWRLVAGVTPDLYQSLEPYLATLPEMTQININTASLSLLLAINPNLTDERVQALLERRRQGGVHVPSTFEPLMTALQFDPNLVGFESQYFMTHAVVKPVHGHQQFSLYTVLKRTHTVGDAWSMSVIRESVNVI